LQHDHVTDVPVGGEEFEMKRTLVSRALALGLCVTALSACGTLTGAAVGAGGGAAVSAGLGKDVGKGALIGAGVGGAAGAIYDITKGR
jgi:hypothetical protein